MTLTSNSLSYNSYCDNFANLHHHHCSNNCANNNPQSINFGNVNISCQESQRKEQQTHQNQRQLSTDLASTEAAGCCLLKTLISNVLTFATRSRRKADLAAGSKEPQQQQQQRTVAAAAITCGTTAGTTTAGHFNSGTTKKTGLTNCSKVGSAKILRRRNGGAAGTQNSSVGAAATAAAVVAGDLSVADAMDDTDVDRICRLPDGLDRNEWLATHTLALFDHVNALCGTVSEVCTPVTCHVMNYPGVSKVSWVDERGKRHNYSAMRYIDSVMSFCEASRKNQQLFPTKFGATFGAEFETQCRRMIRLLWHCSGHLYHKHWEHLCALNLRAQYALVLAHLATFARLFSLLDAKDANTIQNTLQIVRPPVPSPDPTQHSPTSPTESKQQTRPAKRLNSGDDDDENFNGCNGDVMKVNDGVKTSSNKPLGLSNVVADGGGAATKTPSKIAAPAWLGGGGPLAHLFAGYASTNRSQTRDLNANEVTQWSAKIYQQQQRTSRSFVPLAMKSGSWGGHSAIVETEMNGGGEQTGNSTNTTGSTTNNAGTTTTRSFKNFVQTY